MKFNTKTNQSHTQMRGITKKDRKGFCTEKKKITH